MHALALALLQDTTTTPQQQQIMTAMAGMMGIIFFIWFLVMAFIIFCFWRIFTKAGMSGAMSLLMLIPGIGPIIVVCLLAFGDWKVAPIPQYTAVPPVYPPPSFPTQPPTA